MHMFETWGSQNRTGNEQREKSGIKREQKTVRELSPGKLGFMISFTFNMYYNYVLSALSP